MPFDIGIGLILGVFLHALTTYNYGLCLVVGVTASLLPDLDFLWIYVRTKRIPGTEHRDGLHYPLIVVPLTGLIGLLISPAVGLVLALGTFLHFVHDSIGVGFGVKWLFPFRKNSYLFFYHNGLPTNEDMPRKKLYSWNDKERSEAHKKYGDPEWIKHIYFQLHPFGLIEYAMCLLGITIAILKPIKVTLNPDWCANAITMNKPPIPNGFFIRPSGRCVS